MTVIRTFYLRRYDERSIDNLRVFAIVLLQQFSDIIILEDF